MNLKSVPEGQFNDTWWYRTEFIYNEPKPNQNVFLTFNGVNYKANVWFNGHNVAKETEIVGTFRIFDLDVTQWVQRGSTNAVAVEITRPFDRSLPSSNEDTDLAITFVDW